MSLIVKDTGGGDDFEPIPEGMHHAICVGVIDLGTHDNPMFHNTQHQVLIQFELPDQRIELKSDKDGEPMNMPMMHSAWFTMTLHPMGKLRGFLEMWRGKAFTEEQALGFDLTLLLGANCNLQLIHKPNKKGKNYPEIRSITPIPPNMIRQPEHTPVYFSFDEQMNIPESLPDWIKDKIKASEEWHFRVSSHDIDDVKLEEAGEPIPF